MTLREIAIESGVSPATVSFVLNNKPGVSQEIREKIAGKLVENGYTLRNRDTVRDASRGTILFADYEDKDYGQYMLKDEFFKDTLTSIQRVCEEENFKFLFKTYTQDTFPHIFDRGNPEQVDGVILQGIEYFNEPEPFLVNGELPVVPIYRILQDYPICTVNIDNYQSMDNVVGYLHRMGHRDIGYVQFRMNYGCSKNRAEGFFAAAQKYGMHLAPENIIHIEPNSDTMEKQILDYLDRTEKLPTAFGTNNDSVAISLIYSLQQRGIQVPDDVSVVGFDDTRIGNLFPPGLTTTHVDFKAIAVHAARLLISRITQPDQPPVKLLVGTSFVERHSVKRIPVNDE